MVLTKTPICNFGEKPHSFELKDVSEKTHNFKDLVGEKGTLIMFICNHCPYVKAVIKDIVYDADKLKNLNINTVAVMSNDTKNYPADSFENIIKFSKINKFKWLIP